MCISNGLTPAKISLIWNAIDDCQSVYPFTYNVLYCHKPSGNNSFCFRPPRGYNIYRDCTGLIVNSSSGVGSMVVECNVTSLFKRLFPDAWRGIPKITFSINIGNVPSDAYSKFSTCNPLELGMKNYTLSYFKKCVFISESYSAVIDRNQGWSRLYLAVLCTCAVTSLFTIWQRFSEIPVVKLYLLSVLLMPSTFWHLRLSKHDL